MIDSPLRTFKELPRYTTPIGMSDKELFIKGKSVSVNNEGFTCTTQASVPPAPTVAAMDPLKADMFR
jgi:hypothetical protein